MIYNWITCWIEFQSRNIFIVPIHVNFTSVCFYFCLRRAVYHKSFFESDANRKNIGTWTMDMIYCNDFPLCICFFPCLFLFPKSHDWRGPILRQNQLKGRWSSFDNTLWAVLLSLFKLISSFKFPVWSLHGKRFPRKQS